MATMTKRTWTAAKAAFTAALVKADKAQQVVTALAVAVPWWGAAIAAVGITVGTVTVTPTPTKPRIKAVDDDGNFTTAMSALFTLPTGSEDDYNKGCLLAASFILAGVKGATTTSDPAGWQAMGAKVGVLTAADLTTVAPPLRTWYVGPKDDHNVTTMRAVISGALGEKADTKAADLADKADTKAAAAKAKATTKVGSRLQTLCDGMTRTKAKADLLAWQRADGAGFRAFITMGAGVITASDKATAKAAAAADTKAAA